MSTPFKMKGFSGFGNSPLKQEKKKDLPTTSTDTTKTTKSDTTWTEVPGSRTTTTYGIAPGDTTTINRMRKDREAMKVGGGGKSRMLDILKSEFPE